MNLLGFVLVYLLNCFIFISERADSLMIYCYNEPVNEMLQLTIPTVSTGNAAKPFGADSTETGLPGPFTFHSELLPAVPTVL